MSKRTRDGKVLRQAVVLVEQLAKGTPMTREEIQDLLDNSEPNASYAHHIIGFIRNKAGDEAVVVNYDVDRRAYVYSLAINYAEASAYVSRRRMKVRNEAENLVGICDRIIAKQQAGKEGWGADGDIAVVRALLSSVVSIIDAHDGRISA